MCLVAGISMILPGAWHWVLPGVENAFRSDGHQMTTVVSIIVAGLLFFWISVRGLREEVHVDRNRRVVRIMAVNRHGSTRPKNSVAFDKIASAFVKRAGAHEPATLYLRLKEGQPIQIARGDVAALEEFTKRLTTEVAQDDVSFEGWRRVGRKMVKVDGGAAKAVA